MLALLPACSYQLVAPPARMVNLESTSTAAPGETIAGVHSAVHAAIFDPSVGVASAGVRRGVSDGLEVDVDATWAHVFYDGYPAIDRNIYALRGGFKVASRSHVFALLAGAGGGYSPAAGGFTALDAGAVVAYPNCYAVPFTSVTGSASVPVGSKQVDFRNDAGAVVASDIAGTTLGVGLSAGLEIPLAHDLCRRGLTPPRLQIGLGVNELFPTDGPVRVVNSDGTTTERGGHYGTIGLGVGVEWRL